MHTYLLEMLKCPAYHGELDGTITYRTKIALKRHRHTTITQVSSGCTNTLIAPELFLSAAAAKPSPIWSSG
jgi:hypothetical protein